MPTPAVSSPCRKTCRVDPAGRFCVGCLRTLDEIAAWASYSEAERRRVMAELPSREKARAAMAQQQQ